jgi:hypothetical protein
VIQTIGLPWRPGSYLVAPGKKPKWDKSMPMKDREVAGCLEPMFESSLSCKKMSWLIANASCRRIPGPDFQTTHKNKKEGTDFVSRAVLIRRT